MKTKVVLFMFLLSCSAHATNKCSLMESSGVHRHTENSVRSFRADDLQSCLLDGKEVFTLRSLKFRGYDAKLIVDPQTLKSNLVKSSCLKRCSDLSSRALSRTSYGELLERSDDGSYPLQNDGLRRGSSDKYVALTIDMCPSSKGISQNVYDKLVELSKKKGRAIPIGVAMTAAWKKKHSKRFKWIKEQARKGHFKIEWINHSFHHHYKRKVPYKHNFMLKKGTDVEKEVLGNEIAMLKGGVTPSVFFRFPGLVSSRRLMRKITDWGLIALGSDAWLGVGERAKEGSIILIHGNRNEPKGEVKFLDYVKTMDRQRHDFGSTYDVFFR